MLNVESQEIKSVTSIDELIEQSKGELMELPPFVSGKSFYAKLRRPSLLGMIKCGKIPNNLVSAAGKLFNDPNELVTSKEESLIREFLEILDVICGECLVEPRYKDLKDRGIELTDEQLVALFRYTQRGAKALATFRTE